MINENNTNKIKEITILDYPKNIFIDLPNDYRQILFQLIFLESKTARNVQDLLKNGGLKENIFRWRRGHDRSLPQYINLESLLALYDKVRRIRDNINYKTCVVKEDFTNSKERLSKSKELVSLIKDIRLILGGVNKTAKKFNVNPGTLSHYILNEKIKGLPSGFIKNLLDFIDKEILCFEFTIEELQNKIISYHAYNGKFIKPDFNGERKLPIKVTPEFESILFHLFGDGHVKPIGSGEYTQIKLEGRMNFLNKLYNVFGYFDVAEKSFNDGRVIIPKAIILILLKYYDLDYKSFNWNVSELPTNLSNDKEFKIAGLSAFIVDEAHVTNDRGIEIYSSNKKLLAQIRNVAVDLGLNCSELKSKNPNGNTKKSYRFRIKKKSSIEFVQMVKKLKEKYPYVGLAHKEDIIIGN